MRTVTTICDRCKKEVEPNDASVTLSWQCLLGHNQVPSGGWHYHYDCAFTELPDILKKFNETPVKPIRWATVEKT